MSTRIAKLVCRPCHLTPSVCAQLKAGSWTDCCQTDRTSGASVRTSCSGDNLNLCGQNCQKVY